MAFNFYYVHMLVYMNDYGIHILRESAVLAVLRPSFHETS